MSMNLLHSGVTEDVSLIDFENPESLHSPIILNCFEREEVKFTRDDVNIDEPTKEDALIGSLFGAYAGRTDYPGKRRKDLQSMFFQYSTL